MSDFDKLDRRVERMIKTIIGCASVTGICVILLIIIGLYNLFT